jgi:hypothetical protein
VNLAVSTDEDFGLAEGGRMWKTTTPFQIVPGNTRDGGRLAMHQGGIVSTTTGEWWGFSMMDANAVGRLTCLSPITWKDGWPYFGLPGNLKRTPRTWVKPNTGRTAAPMTPYQRNDDFSGPKLANVWQWNHVPVDERWSLTERAGFLRLHSLPAKDFWWARNSLTQRSIGPESIPTAVLDASGLKPGDTAGLALLNLPFAWIGVRRTTDGLVLQQFDQYTGKTTEMPLATTKIWLRAHCNFLTEKATFSYSLDGAEFKAFGAEYTMVFQLKTFQGVRYSLFNYNETGVAGGYADFDAFTVDEPHPNGLMKPIPLGKTIQLTARGSTKPLTIEGETKFEVIDRGLGRVALKTAKGFLSAGASGAATLSKGEPGDAETFQWTETLYGDLNLLSLATHRHLRVDASKNSAFADSPGPKPDRLDGSCFEWSAE